MARVTAEEVKEIIDTDLGDSIVEAFIAGATALIDSLFSAGGLSTSLLKEIERNLAAHMMASTREQQLSEAGASTAKVKFQGITGKHLESTFYGQTAMILDHTGKLSRLGTVKAANLHAIESFD